MSFATLAARANASALAVWGEQVEYRDSAGAVANLQAIYRHSDEQISTERFEAQESDFPAMPRQGDTITRADGSVYQLAPPKRVDGNWLQIDVRQQRR